MNFISFDVAKYTSIVKNCQELFLSGGKKNPPKRALVGLDRF